MPDALPKTISAQVAEQTGQKPRKINLTENAIFVRVSFGRVGTSKKVPNANVTVDADDKLIRVTKRLLYSPQVNAIVKHDAETRQWIYTRCVQSFIQDRLYCVALEYVPTFEKVMRKSAEEREALVSDLCNVYEELVTKDKELLRTNFQAEDYPTVAAVRAAYKMSWQYLALQAPKSLEAVSEDLYKAAQAQINAEISDATDAVRFALREEMAKLIEWGIDRLSPDAGGKRKIFRAKSKDGKEIGFTSKLKDFFEAFGSRNITSDAELQALVNSAKALMTNVDGEVLKTSDTTRDLVRGGFEEIKKTLDTMLIDKPIRAIEVD